ncbi:MAG: MBOAT family O-acyltransferase [Acidobacteriota bacterium]
MLFNTPLFFLFFAGFFLLHAFVFRGRQPRLWLILVGSLVFYAGWNYRFIPLLLFSGCADYVLARAIARTDRPVQKKRLLSLSLFVNLGVLAVFKYSDFALASVADLLSALGQEPSWPTLQVVLPVGISFYTFQSLSYTIDVYRGDTEARHSLLTFLAALSFFPQLVAGPILRARQLLPQLESLPSPTWAGAKHGFALFTLGLFKKTLADLLASSVGLAFDGPRVSVLETWTGVLAFAAQIYGDFSGYTDMALGLALLLGFRLPENFRLPYLATSPVDFWRRWHVSLSTWLRDYLYISLGGNRHHRSRNIMITMALGGLWHGAAWTFVAWGIFHGCLLVATHRLAELPFVERVRSRAGRWLRPLQWALTLYLVLLGWVLFRSSDLTTAWDLFGTLHGAHAAAQPASVAPWLLVFVVFASVTMHLVDWVQLRFGDAIEARGWLFWPLVFLFQLFCFLVGAPSDAFIYFQF